MVEYAKRELEKIKKDCFGVQEFIKNQILEIVEKFSKQYHTSHSATYAVDLLERLLRFKPITPLTGEADEWKKVYGDRFQNVRCSSVFKDEDGTAYDIRATMVSDNGGITWSTGCRFRKYITFPYMPPTHPEKVYIEYTENVPPGFTSENFEIITDQPERIKALYERSRIKVDEDQK